MLRVSPVWFKGDGMAWVVLGDLNEVLWSSVKEGVGGGVHNGILEDVDMLCWSFLSSFLNITRW